MESAELVETFAALSGASKAKATATLSAHKWSLERALDAFFDHAETRGGASSGAGSASSAARDDGVARPVAVSASPAPATLLRFRSAASHARGSVRNTAPTSFRRPRARHAPARRAPVERVNARYRSLLDSRSADHLTSRALLDVDAPPAWSSVAAVAELPGESACPASCPICLSALIVAPRIVPCGHVFCSPCVRRFHAEAGARGEAAGGVAAAAAPKPCPVCCATFDIGDLRPFLRERSAGGGAAAAAAATVLILVARCAATNSAAPYASAAAPSAPHPSPAVPRASDARARFGRIVWASPREILNGLARDRSELQLREGELGATGERGRWGAALAASLADIAGREVRWAARLAEERLSTARGTALAAPAAEWLPASATVSAPAAERGAAPYLFYQCETGRRVFLSPFALRCLREEFGDGSTAASAARYPRALARLPVLERDERVLTEVYRRSKPALRHLPLDAHFEEIDLDLASVLSAKTKARLKGDIRRQRKAQKKRRAARQRLAPQQRQSTSAAAAAAVADAAQQEEREAAILTQHMDRARRESEAAAAARAARDEAQRQLAVRVEARRRQAFPELGCSAATGAALDGGDGASEEAPPTWSSLVQQPVHPWATAARRRS